MASTITFQIEERWGGRKVLALYCSCGLSYEWEADENGMVLIDYSRWEEHLKSDCRDVTEQEWQAVERETPTARATAPGVSPARRIARPSDAANAAFLARSIASRSPSPIGVPSAN